MRTELLVSKQFNKRTMMIKATTKILILVITWNLGPSYSLQTPYHTRTHPSRAVTSDAGTERRNFVSDSGLVHRSRRRRRKNNGSPVRSLLFSCSSNDGDPVKKQRPLPRKRDILRAWAQRIGGRLGLWKAALSSASSRVLKTVGASAAAKLLLNCLLLGIIFGVYIDTPMLEEMGPPSPQRVDAPAVERPITEVPCSTFMDYCETSQQQQAFRRPAVLFHRGPMIHIDNVKLDDSGKIEYRILQANTRSERTTLRQYVDSGGSGHDDTDLLLENIPQQRAYTQSVGTNTHPEIIKTMRRTNTPFGAAGTGTGTTTIPKKTNTDNLLSTVVIAGLAYKLYNNQNNNGGSVASSSHPGKLAKRKDGVPQVSFDDIEGIDDAKHDVMELVDTLRNPEKYSLVGARAPTGLLLEGPPGTGKTTLARACASTADVPLIHCSGSAFVEKYVGTGAARIRQLFARASKTKGPCIVFIDEIDALGKARRDTGSGNGNADEAEQTLNQLLACMDGLDSSASQVCVLGATNRKDVLDPALVRPGRFDRIVRVDLPNAAGRERILRLHTQKLLGFTEGIGVDPLRDKSLGKGKAVDLSAVAAATDGLSGAELECIVNEAAIFAVRRVSVQLERGCDKSQIDNSVYPRDFEESLERFLKSRSKNTKRKPFGITAQRDGNNNASSSSSSFRAAEKHIFFKKSKKSDAMHTTR